MSLQSLAPLVLFVAVSTASPGGATTLAAASGANFGFRRSLPLIAGIAAGLAGMLLAVPSLQLALKAVGSLHLLWLAWRLCRSGPPHKASGAARPASFVVGVWMLWHSPKAWVMTVGAAASFAALADGPLRLGALLFAAFGLAAALSLSLWCAAGLVLARLLRGDRAWRTVIGVLGALLALSIVPIWL